MTSIKDWQDSMSDVDGWAEAVDFIDEDDVKRWTADKKMDPQKFKSALAFSHTTSETMRVHLFADNYFLRAHAESLQLNPHMGIVPRGNTAAVGEVRRAAWGV